MKERLEVFGERRIATRWNGWFDVRVLCAAR
jgi:hypothetical protein